MVFTARPSERIAELARLIVDERMKELPSDSAAQLIIKVTGTGIADVAAGILAKPETWITAMVAFLEEQYNAQDSTGSRP